MSARYDAATGQLTVRLEDIYRQLIDWHTDEDTDREEARIYAERFLLQLTDAAPPVPAHPYRDEAADFWDRFLSRLPPTTRRAVEAAHWPEDDERYICDTCGTIGTADDLVEAGGPCGHDDCPGTMEVYP